MQFKALLLPLLILISKAYADESVMNGGRSPDGAYEVRISSNHQEKDIPDGYGIHIHDVKSEKRLFTLPEIGGYLGFTTALERDRALWHGTSKLVAVTDQGTRHSRELYLVAMSEEGPTILRPPDYIQNALGRIDAVETDFAQVVTPLKWDGDDLVLKVYFTANRRHSYTFEVVLHLWHGAQTSPRLSLKSIKKLKEEEG